jgi:hypothetical protein
MPDAEMDFRTYVSAGYELRRVEGLPPETWPGLKLPYLDPVGKGALVRPKRRALDFAVRLLLQTLNLRPERLGPGIHAPSADEIPHLERNALAIAKHTGLLGTPLNPDNFGEHRGPESLLEWFRLALKIQAVFNGPSRAGEIGVSAMLVFLTYKSDGSRSITVRPPSVGAALLYHAAQMLAKGTTFQKCGHCNTIFLSGGGGRSKDKKRSGSRFCSDECRWTHHNEMRRKAKETL